jgi:hypothetical protein
MAKDEASERVILQLRGVLRGTGFVFTPIGSSQTFFDVGRQAGGHGPVGQPPKLKGTDVIIARHGRIVAFYAFIDTPDA